MAPLRPQAPGTTQTLQHFTHPNHPLQKLFIPTEYKCDGCNTLGSGPRYRCAACDFDLHEQCATCPFTSASHFHPHHQLTLVKQPGNGHFCDLCRQFVNGLFYTCRSCDFDVHPLCTQLPLHVQHPFHPQHPLTLQPEKPGWCDMCRSGCESWRYRCKACDVDVHLECVAGAGPAPANGVLPPSGGGYLNQPVQAGGGGGGVINGSNDKMKVYGMVGKLAAKAVLGSMFGNPNGLF